MFIDKEFDDKKKQRQFAMASVFNGFTLHCCVAFKKACLIKKDVYYHFYFFCLSMFTNKATSFWARDYTRKYWSLIKEF